MRNIQHINESMTGVHTILRDTHLHWQ